MLRYLFGKGKANEHTNPHLVAAWDPEWLEDGVFARLIGQRGWLPRLAREIDAAMTGHEVRLADGHVYHVVLSDPRADGELGAGTWRMLVDDAIEHMGFGPHADGTGGCRWVAVHHGLSVEGNDHVHLVVNLVRGDGTIANTYRDWPRWRAWCLAAEERLDLTRTAPAGAGRKSTSRAELERATKSSTNTERQRLTELVAEAAAAADSEIDFLARLQRANVRYRPRMPEGKVIGYTVALLDGDSEPLWFAGSTLRRDLSLPRLRARWHDPGQMWEGVAARFWSGEREVDYGEARRTSLAWNEVTLHLKEASAAIGDEVTDDSDRWSHTVGETADLVAVLARFDSGIEHLRQVADQLSRAAQLEHGQLRPRPRQPGVALPLLVAATRAAAACKDPTPMIFAGVLLLTWSIINVLANAADRRSIHVRASAHQQVRAAAEELAGHPVLRAEPNRRTRTSPASTTRARHAASSHRADQQAAYRPVDPSRTRGRSR